MTERRTAAVEVDQLDVVERLREVVLDLERAKTTERALREETATLLEGLRAIAETRSADELFSRLLGVMRSPLASDIALVLADPDGKGQRLSVIASTDPAFVACSLALGKTLARALGGRVTTLLDTTAVEELRAAPFDRIASMVLLPLDGERSRALILFGSHAKQAFGPRHEQLVKRLAPLANQALRHVERSELIARAHDELKAEVAERKRVETELRLSQKLEAVGKLASGIAHEINTPVQFVGDSVSFLQEAYRELRALLDSYRAAFRETVQSGTDLADKLALAETAADVDYLDGSVPQAFTRTEDGVQRIATLVRAMKSFGAPDQCEMRPADLNKAITNTLTIAASEYRHIASVVTELGELPPVMCLENEMNQVCLNLIVNAAHAIADAGRDRGEIVIRTSYDDHHVRITVQDNGVGIPEAIRHRIFELFFTTKEVGRGTGQGLAIVQSIVAKHRGSVTVASEVGVGSTFEVRIPVA